MRTFREIIKIWRTPDELAREIYAPIETVRKWRQRNNIPPEWWSSVVIAADRQGRRLSILDFHAIVDRRGPRRSPRRRPVTTAAAE